MPMTSETHPEAVRERGLNPSWIDDSVGIVGEILAKGITSISERRPEGWASLMCCCTRPTRTSRCVERSVS